MATASRSQKFITVAVVLGIAGSLAACLGGFSVLNMEAMASLDCPMTHQTTLCPMALTERLSVWQQLLIPSSTSTILGALLLVLTTLAVRFGSQVLTSLIALSRRQRLFEPLLFGFDYLALQFSRGILHPKIY